MSKPPPPARKRPTILSIAEVAGVSKSVVSRALRGEPGVSERSRKAVFDAVAELGYSPNAAARSLVQQRSYNVGLLISDLSNPFFAVVLEGIDDVAAQHGYRPVITTSNRDPRSEAAALQQLLELRTDAIVLIGPRLPNDVVARATEAVPVVSLEGSVRTPRVDIVLNDDRTGARLAVEHLVSLGHERIAHIDGGAAYAAQERRAGYEETMAAFGLTPRSVSGGFTEDGGFQGVHRLFSQDRPRPTAITTSNDLAAIGALNALEKLGYDVPGDVSLVGYDNTYLAGLRHISLTTINQLGFDMGRIAMEAALRRMERPDARARRHLLPPELVVRASTGPPPAA
ncbi:MAG TPA: LacI family DNA-binding transcriptional regulator [Capillimicrobium sp.]|nr:LacI family DNA-binding transcriptional regulator [Capillimicrobium sp.]